MALAPTGLALCPVCNPTKILVSGELNALVSAEVWGVSFSGLEKGYAVLS